jgi:hypothetical protein
MNKSMIILTLFLLVIPVSAEIEQHEGFPVNAGYRLYSNILVQDIDRDGLNEIIATPENRMVKVFNHNGTLKWENAGGIVIHDNARIPIIQNLSGDDRLEILSYGTPDYTKATFYLWDASGNKLNEKMVGLNLLVSSPAVTKDGIILTGAAPGTSLDGIIAQASGVHAFSVQGNTLWYLELGNSVNFQAPSIPIVDIDGDGNEEAVILTHDITKAYPADGKVHVIKAGMDSGSVLWSRNLSGTSFAAAASDLDGDNEYEVIVLSSAGVYIFDKNGNTRHHFNINNSNADVPAVGDLDGDGMNEIVIASNRDKKIYIIRGGSMESFTSAGWVTSNLAVYDVNGDGYMEILAGDLYANMYLWDYKGTLLERKKFIGDTYFTSVAIADIDNDANMELILGNFNGNIHVYTYIRQVDTTPPVTTDDSDGEWHNSNVSVTLTALDDESGVALTYYTTDGSEPTTASASGSVVNFSQDGEYLLKYFSVDKKGNREDVKTSANQVKIDTTYPITIDDTNGEWHNTSVIVTFVPFDAGSGIRNTYYTTDGSIPTGSSRNGTLIPISMEGVTIIKYYSVDNAGNIEPVKEKTVSIDTTSPFSSDDSDGEWHNNNVTVNLASNDTVSGIEGLYYVVDGNAGQSHSGSAALTFSSEGIHEIVYYGVDNAGNMGLEKSTVVRIDWTPPVSTDDADGEWHNSDVSVTLTASDALSGAKSTYYTTSSGTGTFFSTLFSWFTSSLGLSGSAEYAGSEVPVSGEGISVVHYYSTDNAGNVEGVRESKQVKIDKTPPLITVNVPQEKTYLHSDIIMPDFNAADSLSGVYSYGASIGSGSNAVSPGMAFDMLGLEAGSYEFAVSASDSANNTAATVVRFNVVINIDSLIALTGRGINNGWINDTATYDSLMAKLEAAKKNMDSGQNTSAMNILNAYVNQVNSAAGNTITTDGVALLKSEAGYVIGTIRDLRVKKANKQN